MSDRLEFRGLFEVFLEYRAACDAFRRTPDDETLGALEMLHRRFAGRSLDERATGELENLLLLCKLQLSLGHVAEAEKVVSQARQILNGRLHDSVQVLVSRYSDDAKQLLMAASGSHGRPFEVPGV